MTWICDYCGKPIESVDDGWVEWIILEDLRCRGIRLVHHSRSSEDNDAGNACQYNERVELGKDGGIVGDIPLRVFLGPDGLIRLLAMVAEERHPLEDVLEIIKRLHIPGYEQARLHFDEAISDELVGPDTLWLQSDIKAVVEHYKNEE